MKKMRFKPMMILAVLAMVLVACSSRMESPLVEDDLTIVYPSKKADGISAKINFCREIDNKTGEYIGLGTVFTPMENGNIRAYVDLGNTFINNKRDLMFHIDWIDAEGKSFYLKRIDLSPNDSTSTLNSSISALPDNRPPGEYTLQLYLFRELVAEKKFEILPPFQLITEQGEQLKADITLYRKTSRKTGKRIGEGTEFTIKKKEYVRADIQLGNRYVYGPQELMFRLDWVGPDGKTFYDKQIEIYPNDTTSSLSSSISISPGKREPGHYYFRVYLYDELISEKGFELQK